MSSLILICTIIWFYFIRYNLIVLLIIVLVDLSNHYVLILYFIQSNYLPCKILCLRITYWLFLYSFILGIIEWIRLSITHWYLILNRSILCLIYYSAQYINFDSLAIKSLYLTLCLYLCKTIYSAASYCIDTSNYLYVLLHYWTFRSLYFLKMFSC